MIASTELQKKKKRNADDHGCKQRAAKKIRKRNADDHGYKQRAAKRFKKQINSDDHDSEHAHPRLQRRQSEIQRGFHLSTTVTVRKWFL